MLKAMNKTKPCAKIIAFILALLTVFYVIPSTVFAEESYATAGGADGQASAESEAVGGAASFLSAGVLYEDESLRSENVKHFHLEDGSYIAANYGSPVHTLDEEGKWQDIDNTLDTAWGVASTPDARIKFDKKIGGSGSLFTLHEGNTKIKMSLVGAIKKTPGEVTNYEDSEEDTELQKMMNLEKLTSKIYYSDILSGVDLEYIVTSGDIKENIIVKERGSSYSYTFEISLNNLTAALNESGDVEILCGDGETKYTIPAPVVYDANGVYADRGVSNYTLESSGKGKYFLTVSVLPEWMNAEERAYPVTVDPTITKRNSTNDTFISSTYYNTSYGSLDYLSVSSSDITLIDAPTPDPNVSGYISHFYVSLKYRSGTDCYIAAYPIYYSWNESLTWEFRESYGDGMHDTYTLLDYQYVSSENNGWYVWDIASYARQWAYGVDPFAGIALVKIGGSGSATFESSESSLANSQPHTIIEYTSMSGVEDYYSTITSSAGVAGESTLNLASGNLFLDVPLANVNSHLLPGSVSLVYNSAYCSEDYVYGYHNNYAFTTSYMPKGFKLNISETVVQKQYTDSDGTTHTYFIYTDADGTEHNFFFHYLDDWRDEDGLGLAITYSSLDYITMTDDSHTVRTFLSISEEYGFNGWYLSEITDIYGNKMIIEYSADYKPTKVSVKPAEGVAIDYVSFHYNDSGKLIAVGEENTRRFTVLQYGSTPSDTDAAETGYLTKLYFVDTDEEIYTESNFLDFFARNPEYPTCENIYAVATYGYTPSRYGPYVISSIENSLTGYKIEYEHYIQNGYLEGATKITENAGEHVGQSIQIEYGQSYAYVRASGNNEILGDSDDIANIYQFDERGRSIKITTSSVGGTVYGIRYGEYEEGYFSKNNVSKDVFSNGTSTNYLLNGHLFSPAGTLDYWTATGAVVLDSHSNRVSFSPTLGESASICQYVFVESGEHTLALHGLVIPDGYSGTLEVSSIASSGLLETKELCSAEFNYVTFTVPRHIDRGDKLKVSITFTKTAENSGSASLDAVVLERGIAPSRVNYVNMGDMGNGSINASGENNDYVNNVWAYNGVYDAPLIAPYGSLVITGGLSTVTYAMQTVYTAPASVLSMYDTAVSNEEQYSSMLRGFVLTANVSNNVPLNSADKFVGIWVDVLYYQGAGIEPVSIRHRFAAVGGRVVGYVNTKHTPESDADTASYSCVKEINLYCVAVNQLRTSYFDDVSLLECNIDEVNEYDYYEGNPEIEDDLESDVMRRVGLLKRVTSGRYSEYYEYDDYRNLTRVANSRGEIFDYVYSSYGHKLQEVKEYSFSSGSYPYLEENPDANITKTLLRSTQYQRDSYGQVTQTTLRYYVGSQSKTLISSATYNTTQGSSLFGALTSETDTEGNETLYFYEEWTGRLLAQINPETNAGVTYTYNFWGNVTSVYPAVYSADSYSQNLSSMKAVYSYNGYGLPIFVRSQTTEYSFTYDSFGNRTSVSAGGALLASYEYNDNNGKLKKTIYANGLTVENEYNALENLSRIWYTYGDGERFVAYEYDYTAYGQLYKITDNILCEITEYVYNLDGQIAETHIYNSLTNEENFHSDLEYDDKGRVKNTSYLLSLGAAGSDSGTNYYYYTLDGKLSSYTSTYFDSAHYESYTYDVLDRLVQFRIEDYYGEGFGFYRTVGYNYTTSSGVASSNLVSYSSSVNSTVSTYTYTYDSDGNVTKISYSNGKEIRYYYDTLGQLIREDNEILNATYVYTYDNGGNVLFYSTYSLTAQSTAPSNPTSTKTYSYATSGWRDKLISFDGENISYDEIGNPVSYYNGQSYTFTWNGRRLTGASTSGKAMSFEYNSGGIRTSKTVNGVTTTYYLDGTRILAETRGTEALIYTYSGNGELIGFQYRNSSYESSNWDIFWYDKNAEGDILAIYDELGNLLVSYAYDAWGNFVETVGTVAAAQIAAKNPFRYRSYYYDSDLNLYYLNSRYYDSTVKRFINADGFVSTGQGLIGNNMFAYCNNNPVMHVDPVGDEPMPFSELTWMGEIHNEIENHIVKKGLGFAKEVGFPGIRADLVLNGTYVYEIKPFTYNSPKRRDIAKQQLDFYVSANPKWQIGENHYALTDKFVYKNYQVEYYYMGDGLIFYSFRKIEKKKPAYSYSPVSIPELSSAHLLAAAAGFGLAAAAWSSGGKIGNLHSTSYSYI